MTTLVGGGQPKLYPDLWVSAIQATDRKTGMRSWFHLTIQQFSNNRGAANRVHPRFVTFDQPLIYSNPKLVVK